jgi:hypothetical protein
MQTNLLLLASGIRKFSFSKQHSDPLYSNKGDKMSKIASFGLAPSASFFGRFMVILDNLLMASARIAVRSGDLPYFGL